MPEAPPPNNFTGLSRQRNMVQMKEQVKSPEKELSDEEIANLSDEAFKTLVVRMHTELIDLGCKMKEEIKATQSEIKENIRGTNSDGKETRTQINNLEQNFKKSWNRMKKQEFRKMRRGLGTSRTSLNTATS